MKCLSIYKKIFLTGLAASKEIPILPDNLNNSETL